MSGEESAKARGESRLRPLSLTTWRAAVRSEADRLEDELRRVELGGARERGGEWTRDPDYLAVQNNIADARAATDETHNPWTWFVRWCSGTDVESAWRALHAADQALLMIQDDDTFNARLPELQASVSANILDTERAAAYTERLKLSIGSPKPPGLRAAARVIKQAVDSASDVAHSDMRNYRNWLSISAALLCAGCALIGIVHAANPEFLEICQAKVVATGQVAGCIADSADIVELELAGAFGGLVAAFFALSRLKVYSGPYALPLWQAAIRVPAGSAAGVSGVLLLQSDLLSTMTPQSGHKLVAWAVLFGYAPDLLLRFLDKKVNEVSATARTKSDPSQQRSANATRARVK